ncbi:carbon-monoxide dehydrogenase medium subunit [Arboricoccus pini]|uniref:Carbon-monoxide dehydrogenase medium subunit n=1 Tax=Arboricoccus pini TaxID=1963835 RepID=A0A212Q0G2_9PROT|nr:FAD binding domain-containing protein [Arboricoccus pini]SNB52841.1 carbon-monoxide dehydrogenase medium subunit [Arboricoccus pini]
MSRNIPRDTMALPESVDEALDILAASDIETVPIAGATWIMRGPTRYEPIPPRLVALNRIAELREYDFDSDPIHLGAMATHDLIARSLPSGADLRCLALAAHQSANPGIRRLATVGGNLCVVGFAAADLVPALMVLDATVCLALPGRRRLELDLSEFMAFRRKPGRYLTTGVRFARNARISAHVRVPMRDYPVCIVSLSVGMDASGRIADLRLAVGAVEEDGRRWKEFEDEARGSEPDPVAMGELARKLSTTLTPRSAHDAPGWYRVQVLPAMVRRAFAQVRAEMR